ncbi:MAG TPA: agmatinase [Candidatus Nanoarchaeia archaeon]|nr:agmatinase [Candidatus Nanoarchaeia archaeon]
MEKITSWMNLPKQYQNGKFVILPLPYEQNVTYGKGASRGPEEISNASYFLEYYDEQFDCKPYEKGITLLQPLPLKNCTPEQMIKEVAGAVAQQQNKFVIGLGGDHAVTLGMIQGMEQLQEKEKNRYSPSDFSVIILDAHADFRDSWNGSMYNHACVARQLAKKHDLLLIGIRAMDADEAKMIRERKHVHVIKSSDLSLQRVKALLPKLKKNIYLSIDVDVFDLSFIRNTGTPEPGGLFWNEAIELLQLIFREKNVIGADIAEFAPQENFRAEAYALAKLAYKVMAMKEKK